jgi:nitroreductase
MGEIDLFEGIHSARAMRRFKPDPVPEEILAKVLEAAVCAPSAGNAQNWVFIVVRDGEQRHKLARIYQRASEIVAHFYAARVRPPHMTEQEYNRLMSSGSHLWSHMDEAPVLLVPCLRIEPAPNLPAELVPPEVQARYEELRYNRLSGASIYPAVQNIILACRALGLGTVITTNHTLLEEEVATLLELPPGMRTYALMPIGYPRGRFGPLSRRPIAEVVCADRYGTPMMSG